MVEQLFLWQAGANKDRGREPPFAHWQSHGHLGDVSEALMPGKVEGRRTGNASVSSLEEHDGLQ